MSMPNIIRDILVKNGVNATYVGLLGDSTDNPYIHIEIVDKKENKRKWDYFIKKVCDQTIEIELPCTTSETLKYKFKIPILAINKFLDGISKKYHTVSPKVEKFAVLIKPTHKCNMSCRYCYELPMRRRYGNTVMSMETLDKILHLLSNYCSNLEIIWHGGEPTMAGKEWFMQAYNQVISKYPMLDMDFHLMSNGINFYKDEEWFDLCNYYNIKPGISYNVYYQKFLRPSDTLYDLKDLLAKAEKRGVRIGTIDVITAENYRHLKEIYEYYKSLRISPCFNQIFHTQAAVENGLIPDIEDYTKHYIDYFRYWLWDKDGIFERAAAEALSMVISGRGLTCRHEDCRYRWLGFSASGDIYPCDHYYPDKYYLGNVDKFNSIEDIFNSEPYQRLVDEVEERFKNICSKCLVFSACHGGCHGAAIGAAGSANKVDENYCYFTKELYKAVYNEIRNVVFYKDEANLNPHALELMRKHGFYSIREIKELGFNFDLSHDENLNESEEYKLFIDINHYDKRLRNKGMHVDIIAPYDEIQTDNVMEMNIESRKRDLMNYFKGVLDDVISVSRKAG